MSLEARTLSIDPTQAQHPASPTVITSRGSGPSKEKAGLPGAGTLPVFEGEFCEGDIEGVTTRPLQAFSDERGWLVEIYREDELPAELHPVMAYVSETKPGVVRGPHEHVHQTDYFVFLGPGDFEVYLWDARPGSPTRGIKSRLVCGPSNPCVVMIPPGVVHAYKNVSDHPGWVINAPNQLYAGAGKTQAVDEIRYEDEGDSPYRVK
jgi:dTDP-4-dehydrorhamnose 3,5-epimerase